MANETKQIVVTFKVAENGEWEYEYNFPKGLSTNKLVLFDRALSLAANVLNVKEENDDQN